MINDISVKNIYKNFGKTNALKDVSFEVKPGEIFGFIGPDGAGKTTLFRILATLLIPDEGKALVAGFDPVKDFKKLRKHLGYMPGRFSLYQDLTVEENLKFFASIFGTTIEENYELVKEIYIQIEPFKKRRAGKLSGGMKQKLALSCALIHAPSVLLLDEPTTGVDAVSRKEFWEMLKRLKQRGITIVVSTPYMDEAVLCDRVALIQNGHIMNIAPPENIVKQFDQTLFAVKSVNTYNLICSLREYPFADAVYPFGEFLHYIDKREKPVIDDIYNYLQEKGLKDIVIKQIPANIEDCFMALMKKGGHD